ncbi:hypothetical protein ACCO45_005608 [Purpureocillium lilacinum]|uniref:Uncharacterized protein n=1 Tax=Purpureocillium lilacinum TaxID=33203 RepID=A0ACC4DYJ6_PURLI
MVVAGDSTLGRRTLPGPPRSRPRRWAIPERGHHAQTIRRPASRQAEPPRTSLTYAVSLPRLLLFAVTRIENQGRRVVCEPTDPGDVDGTANGVHS